MSSRHPIKMIDLGSRTFSPHKPDLKCRSRHTSDIALAHTVRRDVDDKLADGKVFILSCRYRRGEKLA